MPESALEIRGIEVDSQTRCAHYHSPVDIVAIKMNCCGIYFACKDCHEALADHPITVWTRDQWEVKAILCGSCRRELAIQEYMTSDDRCPSCNAEFNPGCRNHYHHYFAAADSPEN